MNRMPWVFGIVLALVAGLAIGYVVGARNAPSSRGPQAGPAPSPQASPAAATVDPRAGELEREVTELKAELARKTKEADDATAEIARRDQEAASALPAAAPTAAESPSSLEEAGMLVAELAALDLQGMYSPENLVKQEKIKTALKAAGDDAYAFLEEMLSGEDSGKRFLAVVFLGELDREKSLPLMRRALTDTRDDLVRRMASHTMATKKWEKGLPDLARAMKEDKDWGVRANAAYGAAKMGEAAAIPVLIELYKDPAHSDMERYQVLAGISDVADESTAPLFRGLLETSKDDSTLFLAIGVVQKLKDKAALAPLQAIIQGDGSSLIKDPAKKAYNAIYGQEVYR